MTCASCANRIERKLNKLDGVNATVNYATEKATVEYDPAARRARALVGAVEAAGYHADAAGRRARATTSRPTRLALAAPAADHPAPSCRCRSCCVSMIPALQFDNWQWLALTAGDAGRDLGRVAVPPRRLG